MKALITGITGQDGTYLTKLLLKKGFKIIGIDKANTFEDLWRFRDLNIDASKNVEFLDINLLDSEKIKSTIKNKKPDIVFNLASLSSVSESFLKPVESLHVNGQITLNLLEAIRTEKPDVKFFQASSSEMFGDSHSNSFNEKSAFYPKSPYAIGKVFSHYTTVSYRESYELYACCGILFNHESKLRSVHFVTRKITDAVAKIHLGLQKDLELGNLNVYRDWGYAREYVEAMVKMVERDIPEDFVICTGKLTSLREFVEMSCKIVGIGLDWEGKGVGEKGFDKKTGNIIVKVNPDFYRPVDIKTTLGDNTNARTKLNWQPKISIEELCEKMVESDIKRLKDNK